MSGGRLGVYSVLAGAKRGGAAPLLTHAAEDLGDSLEPLCTRVKGEHLTQDGTEPDEPTCLACLRELKLLRRLRGTGSAL